MLRWPRLVGSTEAGTKKTINQGDVFLTFIQNTRSKQEQTLFDLNQTKIQQYFVKLIRRGKKKRRKIATSSVPERINSQQLQDRFANKEKDYVTPGWTSISRQLQRALVCRLEYSKDIKCCCTQSNTQIGRGLGNLGVGGVKRERQGGL